MSNKLNRYIGLIQWSLIRHKFYIPMFLLVQVILSLCVIYGFSFITNATDDLSQSFLATGAITINMIAVACVLAPQIVNEAKQSGVLNYQKTLPIPKVTILLTDVLVWGILSLAGTLFSVFLGTVNFGLQLIFSWQALGSFLLITMSLILLGFAIAYIFSPNVMAMMTQLIMLGGMLFSPIIYSEDRLPYWVSHIYNFLPFVPVSRIIRSSLFQLENSNIVAYFVVLVWGLISYWIIMFVLNRKE